MFNVRQDATIGGDSDDEWQDGSDSDEEMSDDDAAPAVDEDDFIDDEESKSGSLAEADSAHEDEFAHENDDEFAYENEEELAYENEDEFAHENDDEDEELEALDPKVDNVFAEGIFLWFNHDFMTDNLFFIPRFQSNLFFKHFWKRAKAPKPFEISPLFKILFRVHKNSLFIFSYFQIAFQWDFIHLFQWLNFKGRKLSEKYLQAVFSMRRASILINLTVFS